MLCPESLVHQIDKKPISQQLRNLKTLNNSLSKIPIPVTCAQSITEEHDRNHPFHECLPKIPKIRTAISDKNHIVACW